jgi:acyl carrier protein
MSDLQVVEQVRAVLISILGAAATSSVLDRSSPLLGAIAELDSMAVVSVLTAFEDRFGIAIDDDEIDGSTFATLGSLTDFVAQKLSQ